MTCGVCNPQVFRHSRGTRVFGYAVFKTKGGASRARPIPNLHYMGAETVFTDHAAGHLRNRPGYQLLAKVLRKGDMLILDSMRSLGSKPGYQERNAAHIEALDVQVMVLTKDGEADHLLAPHI